MSSGARSVMPLLLGLQEHRQLANFRIQLWILQPPRRDLPISVYDGTVLAREGTADRGEGMAGEFLGKIHRHMPRPNDPSGAATGDEITERHFIIFRHHADYRLSRLGTTSAVSSSRSMASSLAES